MAIHGLSKMMWEEAECREGGAEGGNEGEDVGGEGCTRGVRRGRGEAKNTVRDDEAKPTLRRGEGGIMAGGEEGMSSWVVDGKEEEGRVKPRGIRAGCPRRRKAWQATAGTRGPADTEGTRGKEGGEESLPRTSRKSTCTTREGREGGEQGKPGRR